MGGRAFDTWPREARRSPRRCIRKLLFEQAVAVAVRATRGLV